MFDERDMFEPRPLAQPLTPEVYERMRSDAQDYARRRKELGRFSTPDEERIERQAFMEAVMEVWPQFKDVLVKTIEKKRIEISLR